MLGRGLRRSAVGSVAVVVAAVVVGCVGNPGPFDIVAHEGSNLTLEDAGGAITFTLDTGTPACDNGQDDDVDGLADTADPDCTSASDDNERLMGAQVLAPTVQPVDIDGAGTMTYDPTEMVVPQREFCLDAGNCLGLTVEGRGGTRTGTVAADGVHLPLTIAVEIDALVGFDGVGTDCEIGPIESEFVASDYDTTTGEAAMVAADAPVPGATGCGDWTSLFNAFLGLPTLGNSLLNATILDAGGQPIQFTG